MTTEGMLDPTGDVVLELRAATTAWPAPFTDCPIDPGAFAANRVPPDGKCPTVVVVKRRAITRRRHLPLADYRFELDCYHVNAAELAILAGLVSAWFHERGYRQRGRRPIWWSSDIGQSGTLTEPGTGYPLERVQVQVTAGTRTL